VLILSLSLTVVRNLIAKTEVLSDRTIETRVLASTPLSFQQDTDSRETAGGGQIEPLTVDDLAQNKLVSRNMPDTLGET
jgi:hypothetical protein